MGISVGGAVYRTMPSKPNKTSLKIGGVYGNLSANRPSTRTLRFTNSQATLYLNQPSYFIGNTTHGGNHTHTLGGDANDYNSIFDDTFGYTLQDTGELTVLINAQLITRQYYYNCVTDCDECTSDYGCSGSDGCGADKYSIQRNKDSALNRMLEFIGEPVQDNPIFFDMGEVEYISGEMSARAITASGVACTDSWGGDSQPNGGRYNSWGDTMTYPDFPQITDIGSSYFDEGANGSVNFKYVVSASSIGTGWTKIAGWDSWYNRSSNGTYVDTCRVWVEFFIRREGQTIYILRRINSQINQGSYRGQVFKYSIKSSVAMGVQI